MSERTCFIHCGTYKTGTTAIQTFLTENSEMLAREGLLVPQAGRSKRQAGHHNLARGMFGLDDFDPSLGGFEETIAEIARTELDRVCLTSEMFGAMHVRPESLVALRDGLAAHGFVARIVVYVRMQDSYLESLYGESVKHGIGRPFAPMAREVLETSAIRHFGTIVLFDYCELASRFATVFGSERVIVRPYLDAVEPSALIADFSETLGMPGSVVRMATATPTFANGRLKTGDVITLLFGHSDGERGTQSFGEAARELLRSRPAAATAKFAPLADDDRVRFRERFSDSNARLARERKDFRPWIEQGLVRESEVMRGARNLFAEAEAMRGRMLEEFAEVNAR